MASTELEEIIDKFNSFTHKPVKFLSVQIDLKDDIKCMVKSLYDFTKSQENKDKNIKNNALSELIIEDFDEEQIWQEIELQNTECWDRFVWDVANSISTKSDLIFPVEVVDNISRNPSDPEEEDEEPEDAGDESDRESDDEEFEKQVKTKPEKKKVKSSIVDDKFFKLQEMEDFLLKEERKEEKGSKSKKAVSDSDDESVDYFEDIDDDDNDGERGNEARYSDFFDSQDQEYENSQQGNSFGYNEDDNNEYVDEEEDGEVDEEEQSQRGPHKHKKVRFADMSDDSEDSDGDNHANIGQSEKLTKQKDEKQSEFELRQQRLKEQISRLEERTLKEAPWQLKGEIDATKRPQNSLLQEVVDFDQTSRPAPIITEQTTLTLEQIIKQRVKDKAWDDVVKKEKPVDDQLSFRKTVVLDQAKSKQGLAQVYEAEYLKQKQALSGEVEEEKEPEEHKEIRDSMTKLFAKLDALSHYHYTPKAPQAEIKIVSNTPAISMEEVAPVATSDAALLAPEEVKRKRKGDLVSKDERTQTDKNRERRKKKKLQKLKGNPMKVTEHRNTKKAVELSDKSLKTSKAFFQQLNDDSSSLIKKKSKSKGQK